MSAQVTITQLPAAGALTGSEVVPIVQNGQTVRTTTSAIGLSGGVTSVATGTGLTGGPITTTGTISLDNTTVTAGSYTLASITVNAQGQITAASNGTAGGVTTLSGGTTGLTPATATAGAVTLAGTLNVANGGTGQTTAGAAFNALSPVTSTGDLIVGNGANSATRLGIGTNGYVLTVSGGTAVWAAAAGGGGVTTFSGGTTGLTPSGATSGAITLAGTLAVANGGTGVTTSTGTGNTVLSTSPSLTTPTQASYESWTSISAPSYVKGRLWYDSAQEALSYYNDATNNAVHIGQETIVKVINNTGSTIAFGAPVYITNTASGSSYPNIALAQANSTVTAAVIGITNTAIANGAIGYVVSAGMITGINTASFNVGDILYLSPYSAGQIMNSVPPTGYVIQIGVCAYGHAALGSIYTKQTTPLSISANIVNVGQLAIANGGTGTAYGVTGGTF